METEGEKLKKFREQQGLSQSKLAEALCMAQASIAMMEKNTRPITSNFKLAFLKTYGIDWDTQILNGESFKYEHLEDKNVVPIPFYSAKAAAGLGEELPDYPEKDIIYFDARWLRNILGVNPNNISIIQAKGDSMDGGKYPIKDGDLLIVDDSVKEIINNNVFIIRLHNTELVVKKVVQEWDGTIKLISNNPNYKERVISPIERAEILGKVVKNISSESL